MNKKPQLFTVTKKQPRGRAFVQKSVTDQIGQRHGQLTILSRAPRKSPTDRNCRVHCECSCGKLFDTRLAAITAGKVISCGCVKIAKYKEFWDRKAECLPQAKMRRIFLAACRLPWRVDLNALKNKVAPPMIGAAVRVYGERLKAGLVEATHGVERAWLRKKSFIRPTESLDLTDLDLDGLGLDSLLPAAAA